MVHPDQKVVFPSFPEAITHQDGDNKNDCELNASNRLLKQLREAFPQWSIRVVEDSLFANGPHLKLLKELDIGYIISVKPEGQDSLFAEVRERFFKRETEEFEVVGDDKIVRGYRWINHISLNKSHPDLRVNFLDYWEIREGKEFNFSWITDIQLTKDHVEFVMKGGRSRWHIENQTFNTLKNQDYEFGFFEGSCGAGRAKSRLRSQPIDPKSRGADAQSGLADRTLPDGLTPQEPAKNRTFVRRTRPL